MAKIETRERKTPSSRKSNGSGAKSMLRSVVGSGAATDTIVDLVERLGLVDLVVSRVKSRIEETDMDELMDDATDYLRRNPEVLVVGLGAVTVATGLLVWLDSRRESDREERGTTVTSSPRPVSTTSAAPARVRRTSAASRSEQ